MGKMKERANKINTTWFPIYYEYVQKDDVGRSVRRKNVLVTRACVKGEVFRANIVWHWQLVSFVVRRAATKKWPLLFIKWKKMTRRFDSIDQFDFSSRYEKWGENRKTRIRRQFRRRPGVWGSLKDDIKSRLWCSSWYGYVQLLHDKSYYHKLATPLLSRC